MRIGVPKETKPQENRIGLTPNSVKALTSNGHEVLVENKMKNQNSFFGRIPKITPVIFDSSTCNPGDLIKVKIIS